MIEQQDVKRQYPVSGGTATSAGTVFPFNIRFFDKQDVVCFLYNPTTEVEETLFPGIDYTVEDKEDYSSGANVTLTKQTAGSNTLTIVRSVVPKQNVHMPNFGRIPSESLETQMDRTVAVVQQLQDEMKQVYAMPYGVSGSVTPAQAIKDLVGGGGGGSDGSGGGSAAYASSAGTATVASAAEGLTSAAASAIVSSAAAAVTVTSVAEAGVASGLTNGAKADIVSSAAAAVVVTSVSSAGYADSAGSLTSAAEAAIVSSATAGIKTQLPEWPAGNTIAGYGGKPQTWTNLIDVNLTGKSFVAQANGAILMVLNFDSAGGATIAAEYTSGGSTFSRVYPIASCGGPGNHVHMTFPIQSGTTYTLDVKGCRSLDSYIEVAYNTASAVQTMLFDNSGWTAPDYQSSSTEDETWVATSSSYGTVKVLTEVSSATDGSAVVVPTVNAMIDYVSSHGGGGGGTIIYSGGTADFASSAGALTAAAASAIVSSAAAAVTSVSEAGVASSLTAAAKADILASAGGSGGSGTIIYSGGTADFASSAGGLTAAAKADIVSSAGGTVSQGTLLTVTDAGDISASPLSSFSPTVTSAVNDYSALGTVVRVDTIDLRWGGPSGLNAFAVPTVNAVQAHVSSYVSSNTKYKGPFAVTTSGTSLKVAGGRMYLGGAEYAVGSTTLTSSNGTVYYYVYYSSGSYYSGCSVAASASALAAVIRGSQGYYTALANVQGGSVTQCHYGDIRIDGRVS